jgi:hypothetical protein
MSKIKDLYAIENDIDDLKPIEPSLNDLANAIASVINRDATSIREKLAKDARYECGVDDEGHPEYYIENFVDMCDFISETYCEDYVRDNQIDIDDVRYKTLTEKLSAIVQDKFADYESELINNIKERE